MKPEELRIGNLVIYSETQTAFELTDINSTGSVGIGVKNDEEQTWIELEYFEPIPLTSKILEAAGFNRDKGGWYLSAEYKIYDPLVLGGTGNYVQADTKIFSVICNGHYVSSRGIRYLHQLQNLFYSLTGEELPINLLQAKQEIK